MTDREAALAALQERLTRATAEGDPAAPLTGAAQRDAEALLATGGPEDLAVAWALGWFHWMRFLALDSEDEDALREALRYLVPVYAADPAAVPEPIRRFLRQHDPAAMARDAIGLFSTYRSTGDPGTLEEAVALSRAAVAASHADDPNRAEDQVIRRVTSAGIRRVHDKYITSPRQVHDRLNQIQSLRGDTGKPLRHYAAARAAPRSAGSVARHGAVPVLHPAAGDAHPVTASVAAPRRDGAGLCGSLPRAAGTNKTSPPSVASRTAENRPPGMRGMHQSGEQSGRPRNGTKRARIGKASGSTDRSFGPDAVRLPASPR